MHLTSTEIADLFRVTERTVRHWRQHGFPHHVEERLSLINGTHTDWPNFSIGPGYILTPVGDKIHRNEIENHRWLYRMVNYESKRNDTLCRRIRELEVANGSHELRTILTKISSLCDDADCLSVACTVKSNNDMNL